MYNVPTIDNQRTTLSSSITSATSACYLSSAMTMPSANGALQIDNETIGYSTYSGYTLGGLTRGLAGTTAASHTSASIAKVGQSSLYYKDEQILAPQLETGCIDFSKLMASSITEGKQKIQVYYSSGTTGTIFTANQRYNIGSAISITPSVLSSAIVIMQGACQINSDGGTSVLDIKVDGVEQVKYMDFAHNSAQQINGSIGSNYVHSNLAAGQTYSFQLYGYCNQNGRSQIDASVIILLYAQ